MKKAVLLIFIILAVPALWAQNRYALVIGNANYAKADDRLPNAINDTNDISAALRKLGYQVVLKQNLSRLDMIKEIDAFIARLKSNRTSSEGFFWYAGHAMLIDGDSILLPLDVNLESESLILHTSYSVASLTKGLEAVKNKVNVVVLDACRVPPSVGGGTRNMGDTTRVIKPVAIVSPDLFVIYSTASGTVAYDGKGKRNSPFTEAFLKHIESTEPLTMMIEDVGKETRALTNQLQTPFLSRSLGGEHGRYSLNQAGARPGPVVPPVAPDPAAGEALVRAAQTSDEIKLRAALKSGANIDYLFNERTALMEACFNQWPDGIRILVEEGKANINFKNMSQQTALLFAVQIGNVDIVVYLVEKGANVNDKDRQNKTVLMYAVENQNNHMEDFLIRAGANTGATDTFGQDALILAAKARNWHGVSRLLQVPGINTSQTDSEGKTAFIYACENEDTDMLQIFIIRGFDVLKQDSTGVPPLLWLIQHKKSLTVIEYLVKTTNALNSRDKNGRDAKWYADRYEGDTRLRRLIESGR